jgi:hypothetical protein
MTERTFTYTWTDAKRLTVLHALGFMFAKLQTTPPLVTDVVMELIHELSTTSGTDDPRLAQAPPWIHPALSADANAYADTAISAARAVFAPPQPAAPMDYFQRDKKGNLQMSAPDGAELSQVKLLSAQKFAKTGKAPYLQVLFAAGTTVDGRVRPAGKANCFDPDLWNPIKNREGQVASLWIQESGNYLNVVGVRV